MFIVWRHYTHSYEAATHLLNVEKGAGYPYARIPHSQHFLKRIQMNTPNSTVIISLNSYIYVQINII